MASATRRSRRLGTACDRCYELKERCERAQPTSACARCNRLAQVCLTVRPEKAAGRRPQHRRRSASQTTPSGSRDRTDAQSPLDVSSWLFNVSELQQEEKELLMFLLDSPKTLQHYVVSSSFEAAEQRSLVSPLQAALPVLKDAYLAFAGVLKSFRSGNVVDGADGNPNSSLRRACTAMITLRTLPVATLEDAALCLTLGVALSLFVYGAVGAGVFDICHYCLTITRPFLAPSVLNAEMEPQLIFLVLMETMECIVHRQKPTLRIQPRAPERVDRHLGLCLPLLPYYHDLCVISHSLINTSDPGIISELQQQLNEIQVFVDGWQPSPPDCFVHQFSSAEVVHLLTQARVYRLAAFLMIHRLRHTFGEEDNQADTWSREVLNELDLTRRMTKQSTRFVTLPFIIAAVEIRDPIARKNALLNVDNYVDQLSPVIQRASKVFLSRVWNERDVYKNCSWLDSVHKPCVILDSIDATLLG